MKQLRHALLQLHALLLLYTLDYCFTTARTLRYCNRELAIIKQLIHALLLVYTIYYCFPRFTTALLLLYYCQDPRYRNRELAIMKQLKHPNIVPLLHYYHARSPANQVYSVHLLYWYTSTNTDT
jgi:hypothetical protein